MSNDLLKRWEHHQRLEREFKQARYRTNGPEVIVIYRTFCASCEEFLRDAYRMGRDAGRQMFN